MAKNDKVENEYEEVSFYAVSIHHCGKYDYGYYHSIVIRRLAFYGKFDHFCYIRLPSMEDWINSLATYPVIT